MGTQDCTFVQCMQPCIIYCRTRWLGLSRTFACNMLLCRTNLSWSASGKHGRPVFLICLDLQVMELSFWYVFVLWQDKLSGQRNLTTLGLLQFLEFAAGLLVVKQFSLFVVMPKIPGHFLALSKADTLIPKWKLRFEPNFIIEQVFQAASNLRCCADIRVVLEGRDQGICWLRKLRVETWTQH